MCNMLSHYFPKTHSFITLLIDQSAKTLTWFNLFKNYYFSSFFCIPREECDLHMGMGITSRFLVGMPTNRKGGKFKNFFYWVPTVLLSR